MKFLEDQELIKYTQELTDSVYGSRIINGRIEAFSCKRAGTDKKVAHNLSQKFDSEIKSFNAELQKSRQSLLPAFFDDRYYSSSPLGDFHEMGTQRLMTNLILTLNLSFPDYDFSCVRPCHFVRVKSPALAKNEINEKISEFAITKKRPAFLTELWQAVDNVISLSKCEVFSFVPSDSNDFFSTLTEGFSSNSDIRCSKDALWCFNYFFFNRSLKRIVFFTCVESYLVPKAYYSDDSDTDMTFDMDYVDYP